MSSIAGRGAYPNAAAYCAAKFGVTGLAQVLRAETKNRGIGSAAFTGRRGHLHGRGVGLKGTNHARGGYCAGGLRYLQPRPTDRRRRNCAPAPARGSLITAVTAGPQSQL